MGYDTDRLPRKCGDGQPDGHGCGLFFAADRRAEYVEHKGLCARYPLPRRNLARTNGMGRPVRATGAL